jgi:hypothetical protein
LIQTFSLDPLPWSTASSITPSLNVGVATRKNLLVYLDASNSELPVMAVRRRNSAGAYVPVANFTEEVSPAAVTNGEWTAVLPLGGGATLFNIDASNTLSEASFIPTIGGFILSDDTFVSYDPVSENDDGNYTIRTYEYNAANNNWTSIAAADLQVTFEPTFYGDFSSYRATDTHLTFLDTTTENYTIQIYERQADKSWTYKDSINKVNSTLGAGSVTYNGVDTLVFALPISQPAPSIYGIVFIYTKVNGVWKEQILDVVELGFQPVGLIGGTVIFLDANTMLVSVALDGYTGGSLVIGEAGKILMLTRNQDGTWQPALDLTAASDDGVPGLFGIGMGVNDFDVVVASLTSIDGSIYTIQFYAGSSCFAQPINVTCNDQQVSDCSSVAISEMYTVYNPQCGAVTAKIDGFSLVNNQALETQFTFSKGFGATISCSSTVTCPAPPVTVSPVSNVTSSAGMMQLGLVALLGFFFVMLL